MFNDTPLGQAFYKKDFSTAEKLIEEGERIPDDIQSYQLSAIYTNLIREQAFSVISLLAKKGNIATDIYEYDDFEKSIFKEIFTNLKDDDESMVSLSNLLSQFENINDEVAGKTLLSYAIEKGASPKIVRALIDYGIKTDFKNNAEDNLLNQAVKIRMQPQDKVTSYVQMLMDAGVDLNEANIEGVTAIIVAVNLRKDYLLPMLLDNGADPGFEDKRGNTAFYYALVDQNNPEAFQLMSQFQTPDFTRRNVEGQTIFSAFLRGMGGESKDTQLLKKLIEDGADLNDAPEWYSKPKSGWDWIVEKPANVLEAALEASGYDVNGQDDNGNTLLHKVCAINTNYDQQTAKELYKKAKVLLAAGADVSITNNQDKTPVMLTTDDNLKAKLGELLLNAQKQNQ